MQVACNKGHFCDTKGLKSSQQSVDEGGFGPAAPPHLVRRLIRALLINHQRARDRQILESVYVPFVSLDGFGNQTAFSSTYFMRDMRASSFRGVSIVYRSKMTELYPVDSRKA
ncbi:hypothetical protein Trydic_g20467 [Trypoxylus dichotomus]